MTAVLRPPLKWAGGKRWLVAHLQELTRPYRDRRLVEPFCGGLAVTLGLLPDQALLNDINPHLVNFMRWLQRGLQITLPMHNDSTLYYTHRQRFNELIRDGQSETQEAAGLFYYLNRTGYNGLCRFNRRGGFNVPFGRYAHIQYTTDFTPYQALYARWEFTVGQFENLSVTSGDLIYADPPYDVEFVSYSKEGFTWQDQVRLVDWLLAHNGPVIVSNQATERIVALYQRAGFDLRFLDAPRKISSSGDRTPAREVLAVRLRE